jgi:outer membrane protein assembly factor BamA
LSDLFLGYPSLVRGYDNESFTPEECGGAADGSCPPFDRLLGSRIAVGNVELRLPLLGGAGLIPGGGFPPIEAAAFLDAGAAWRDGESFQLSGRDRRLVTSHGMALRVNLLGFAVAEIDFVHPNDRPDKDWYWLFSLQPGF